MASGVVSKVREVLPTSGPLDAFREFGIVHIQFRHWLAEPVAWNLPGGGLRVHGNRVRRTGRISWSHFRRGCNL